MQKQYKVNLSEEQLKQVIELAKRGIINQKDRELIRYLEYVLRNQGIEQNTLDWVVTSQLDEIPF